MSDLDIYIVDFLLQSNTSNKELVLLVNKYINIHNINIHELNKQELKKLFTNDILNIVLNYITAYNAVNKKTPNNYVYVRNMIDKAFLLNKCSIQHEIINDIVE